MKRSLALILVIASMIAIGVQMPRFMITFKYQLPTWTNYKAYSPYPMNYVARLKMLEGWSAAKGDGLNCSGFISNAHGVRFRRSYDFYSNRYNDMTLITEVSSVRGVDETLLQPGDVAAFEGEIKNIKGSHVAAYLGNGVWTDADGRREDAGEPGVSTWHLSEKHSTDAFFEGHVRLYRWNEEAKFAPLAVLTSLGKGNI